MSEVRISVVDGQFYPADPETLKREIQTMSKGVRPETNLIGCISPHAGYPYSGHVAAEVLARFGQKDTFVILGPNHTGYGANIGIYPEGKWQTPLGDIDINEKTVNELVEKSDFVEKDIMSHRFEHSIEVQIPFLQVLQPCGFKIVPIAIMQMDETAANNIAGALARIIKNSSEKTGIIASSDMTHYESKSSAEDKDKYVIESILKLDPNQMLERIKERQVSMCGYLPVILMLKVMNLLGAKKADLIKYSTSGDITGDHEDVVGYAGIGIYR